MLVEIYVMEVLKLGGIASTGLKKKIIVDASKVTVNPDGSLQIKEEKKRAMTYCTKEIISTRPF